MLSFETEERLILFTLRLSKREHVAVITPAGWEHYKRFPSKRVQARVKRYLRWRQAFLRYHARKKK